MKKEDPWRTIVGWPNKSVFWLNYVVIVERIKNIRASFYRPPLPEEESAGVHPDILTLMKQCWAEEPAERPSFDEVAKALKIINKGKSVLLLQTRDTLFIKMENSSVSTNGR